jgi:hypothetical protein
MKQAGTNMRITSHQLRQIIKEELQREFMSSRSLKLADFGADLPPIEPPEPERERGGGPSGIKAWMVSPMEMRHDGGKGTEQSGRFIVGRSTLIEFLRKWSVSLPVTRRVKGDVDRVLAEIAASAFDDLEDDEDFEDDYGDEEDYEPGWNPQGERPERAPRDSYALVTLDFTGGSPPYAKVTRLDSY